jgi:hypothetical protein
MANPNRPVYPVGKSQLKVTDLPELSVLSDQPT